MFVKWDLLAAATERPFSIDLIALVAILRMDKGELWGSMAAETEPMAQWNDRSNYTSV